MSRTEYKNKFARERYDRLNLVLPKGQKDVLKEQCDKMELSVNEYIRLLIQDDMKSGTSKLKEKMSGFTDEQYGMMDKWQIPAKYRDMIQDFHHSKEDGYFIKDLIGIEVFENDEKIGIVKEIFKTGANDVYEIIGEDGKSMYIPAIKQVVKSIDIKSRKMIVELMEGLK